MILLTIKNPLIIYLKTDKTYQFLFIYNSLLT